MAVLEQQQALFAQQHPGRALQKSLERTFRLGKAGRRVFQQHFGIEILAEPGQELVQPAADGFGGFHFEILGLLVAGEHCTGSFFARLNAQFRRVAGPEQALVLAGEIGLIGGLQGLLDEVTRGGRLRGFEVEPTGQRLIKGYAVQVIVERFGQAGAEGFVVGAEGVCVPEVVPGETGWLRTDGFDLLLRRIFAHGRVRGH